MTRMLAVKVRLEQHPSRMVYLTVNVKKKSTSLINIDMYELWKCQWKAKPSKMVRRVVCFSEAHR